MENANVRIGMFAACSLVVGLPHYEARAADSSLELAPTIQTGAALARSGADLPAEGNQRGAISTPAAGQTIQATAGAVLSPFVISDGCLLQPVETLDLTNSGRATYKFSVATTGEYAIQAFVHAPGKGTNSLFLNIDAEPEDPGMIWDIRPTVNFEARIVAWRGNGTEDAGQFIPKYFKLTNGIHQIVIRGRQPNVRLHSLKVLQRPSPPKGLRAVGSP